MDVDWGWISDHLGALAERTGQHLYLAGIAVAIGFAISFLLAIAAIRRRVVYPPIAAVARLVYTIPRLALFAAPLFISRTSIVTAYVTPILYTFEILIRSIAAA